MTGSMPPAGGAVSGPGPNGTSASTHVVPVPPFAPVSMPETPVPPLSQGPAAGGSGRPGLPMLAPPPGAAAGQLAPNLPRAGFPGGGPPAGPAPIMGGAAFPMQPGGMRPGPLPAGPPPGAFPAGMPANPMMGGGMPRGPVPGGMPGPMPGPMAGPMAGPMPGAVPGAMPGPMAGPVPGPMPGHAPPGMFPTGAPTGPMLGAPVRGQPGPVNLAATVPGVSTPSVAPVSPAPPPGQPAPLPELPQPPTPQGFPPPFQHPGAPVQGMPHIPPGAMPNPALIQMLAGNGQTGGGQPGPVPMPIAGGAMPVPARPAAVQPGPGSMPLGQGVPGMQNGSGSGTPAGTGHLAPWIQLASHLLQTPSVRSTLGSALDQLTSRPETAQFVLGVATGILTTAEGQGALKDLATGAMDSPRFTGLFANRLKSLLEMHGLVPRSN